jgi:hypothetical protein
MIHGRPFAYALDRWRATMRTELLDLLLVALGNPRIAL